MSLKNPIKLKILSFIAIILIGGLEYFLFVQNKKAILEGENFYTTSGKVIEHKPFESIVVRYKGLHIDTIIQVEKRISEKYDPFINIELNKSLSVTYDKNNGSLFYLEGFEDKPSSFVFYFILCIGLISQILLFCVIIDLLDNNLQKLK